MMLPQVDGSGSRNGHSGHAVQLFDAPESLGVCVAGFLQDGLSCGAGLLVIGKPAHNQTVADALVRQGCQTTDVSDRLSMFDAQQTLGAVMRHGTPDPALFDLFVAQQVRRLCGTSPAPLRVYSELVEILAEEGNFRGAAELEDLWNVLGTTESFSLLCGYSSAHFAASDAGDALQRICDKHTRIEQSPADLLGCWLLASQLSGPGGRSSTTRSRAAEPV